MSEDYQTRNTCPCLSDEALQSLCDELAAKHAARTPEAAWRITRAALRRWSRAERPKFFAALRSA